MNLHFPGSPDAFVVRWHVPVTAVHDGKSSILQHIWAA